MNIRKRKVLAIILLVGIFACSGYTYLWFHTAEKLEDWLLETIAGLEQRGYLPSYDRIEIRGFPFKLEVRLSNPCIQLPKPIPLKISASGMMIATTCVWRPFYVTIRQGNQTSLYALGDEEEKSPLASLDQFQVQAPLNDSFFNDYSIMLKGIHMETWSAEEIAFECLKKQSFDTAEKINLNIKSLSFKSRFDKEFLPSTIQHIALKANLWMPKTLEGDIGTTLKAWYEQDGTVDVKKFNMTWGDIEVEGNGSLSLDQDLQPLGAFGVKIHGIDPLFNLLVQQKLLHKRSIPFIKAVLSPLSRTHELNKQMTYYQVSISLQDRELSIEGIPITKFDKINWKEINF